MSIIHSIHHGYHLLCISAMLTLCATVTAQTPPASIEQASIQIKNGVPLLTLNNAPYLPLVFFPNTDIPGEYSREFLRSQVALARDAGVHLYSFPFRVERSDDGKAVLYTRADNDVAAILEADPQAVFLLRMFPGPWPFWAEWKSIPESELSLFADGTHNFISMASSFFWDLTNNQLANDIRHVEESPYGNRIIGYHVGGPEHEMFADKYREKGPDYSPVNQARFRIWLREQYKTDEALQAAWGRTDITLDTASMPPTEPGRFPMHGIETEKGLTVEMFYQLPKEQDWIDYSLYVSDITAERIIDWAKLIKQETQSKKLAAFFYGYTFELCGSFSGHSRLDRVLACPEVDILASPYTYMGRVGGDPGGFMSPVDSISAHGKLWFNEDDSRTSVLDIKKVPPSISLWCGGQAKDMQETLGMLGRNLGNAFTHRAGTWWMDLLAGGAFNDPAQWALMKARMPLYKRIYDNPSPYHPDVAFIVDERSKAIYKSDWDAYNHLLFEMRNISMKAGVTAGFYTLKDFIDGVVPPCKAYLFPNTNWLTTEQTTQIRARLAKEQATALWVYAPNAYGPKGFDAARCESLTGIKTASKSGVQGSTGEGLLAGMAWGWAENVSPRPVVEDPEAEVMGRYDSDGAISAARKKSDGFQSVYLADIALTPSVMRKVFEQAGAHIWTSDDSIVQCDGRTLEVHRSAAGPLAIRLPEGIKASVISGTLVKQEGGLVELQLERDESAWLELSPVQ